MGLDGHGVRTLIGTSGCSLRCRYCLNPQSWGENTAVTWYTPQALYETVRCDDLYFQATGGGLTFGGGEPLMHMQGIARLAQLCPDSWTLWAETSLYVRPEQIILAQQVFHHFLVDIKTTDPEIFRAYTGADPGLVLSNLKLLLDLAGPDRITVRLPRIPGYVTEQSRSASAEVLQAMGIRDLDYLNYIQEVSL